MITNLAMMSHPNPRNVLVIGGGDGGVLREIVKHDCVEKADLCDIDEAVPRLSKKYLPGMAQGLNHKKANVTIDNGLQYIKRKKNEYDVIITDSSDPIGPAEKLFEKQYFQDCFDALREGGVLSTQGCSSYALPFSPSTYKMWLTGRTAESFWNNLDFIMTLKAECKQAFPVVEWAWSSTPTYPSGSIGYIVATKDHTRDVKIPVRSYSREEEDRMFQYYNKEVHSSSFVIPTMARKKFSRL